MADDQLVVNNQGQDNVKINPGGTASDSGDISLQGSSGDLKNVKQQGNTISFDVDLNYPSAARPPKPGTTSRTRTPSSGSSSSTTAPTYGERVTSAAAVQNPYLHPDAQEFDAPSPSQSKDTDEQGDFNKDLSTPPTLDTLNQMDAASDMQADQLKGLHDDNVPSGMYNDPPPPPEDKMSMGDQNAARAATDDAHPDNLMKGDIGNVSSDHQSTPKEISPEAQQQAAAKNNARLQMEQQSQKRQFLASQEAKMKQSIGNLKGKILSGKYASLAKKIPIIGSFVRRVERAAEKSVLSAIKTLERFKRALQAAKIAVAEVESFTKYFEFLGSLCATGLGIVVAIIIFIPGAILVASATLIAPKATSKSANVIDKLIKIINDVLIPLKKYYTTQQQAKVTLLRNKQLQAAVSQTPVQPPPKPS